ncbi:class-II aminoacyl-tRNA synthetase family protein [Spiroplasma culicicola]|uniref:Asparagine synthetase AsnA n=1 Tax=Spiroplasma culicicola AES-1 TaxID=1276246 RepID=W6A5Z2_9MOLU|nr:hypothetical protein [Spiroplasma culicicola]AHI52361.1 asparagine synthetase AsnA [Spiroplasma culicicola AES-1]
MKYGITLGYVSKLNQIDTLKGIEKAKSELKKVIKKEYKLIEVSSAIVTEKNLWLNDDFQQSRRPIDFDISSTLSYGEIMQSNNKWRRFFLMKNDLSKNNMGIMTEFNSIQRDMEMDNTSSITFQELGIEIVKDEYDINYVNEMVIKLFEHIVSVDKKVASEFEELQESHFGNTIIFITFKKLKELYPLLTFKERLNKFGRENGSFVLQDYVEKMFNQTKIQQFSSDIFDFKTYSRIYYYNKSVEKVLSLGYVSYQVDREMLKIQNNILKENTKTQSGYQHLLKSNKLPLTISGGIYLDRLTMAILEKQHIAEVHSTIWDDEFVDYCETNKIKIL